jgi:hypothetical protein
MNRSSTKPITSRATERHIRGDGILHSHRRENLKFYVEFTGWALERISNVSPVRYEQGFFISQEATFFIVTAVKTSNLT